MGFVNRVQNFAQNIKRLTTEQATRNEQLLKSLYSFNTSALQALTYQNLKQVVRSGYETNVDVFSVVNWIAERASRIPLKVQQLQGDEWIDVPNHPLQRVIDMPNPYQDGYEHRSRVISFYLITGNGFVYAPRLEGGRVEGQIQEMWNLPSHYVDIITGGWMNPIEGYQLNMFTGFQKQFDFTEVMHMKTVNMEYGNGQELWGMSPLRAGLLALDRSNANYQSASTAYKTMGMAGIISEKQDGLPSALSDEQRQNEEERISEDYNGVFNYGKVMVTNADITYTPIGLSPVDLNLIADKKATLRDFCNIYNVSSILFNDNENSTYNNMLEAKKSAITDAVIPAIERYVSKLTQWVLPSYERNGQTLRIYADTSAIPEMQANKKEQAEWVSALVDRGIMKRTQAQAELGLPISDDESADILTVGLNVMPLDSITADPFMESDEAKATLAKYGIK